MVLWQLSRKYKSIFSIQDEPPSWPSDSDEMGMESVSDIDMDAFSMSPEPEGDDVPDSEDVPEAHGGDRRSIVREDSTGTGPNGRDGRQSEEVTTEEEANDDPLTPGPGHSPSHAFEDQIHASRKEKDREEDLLGDDEEWVDTTESSALMPMQTPLQELARELDGHRARSGVNRRSTGKERGQGLVVVGSKSENACAHGPQAKIAP